MTLPSDGLGKYIAYPGIYYSIYVVWPSVLVVFVLSKIYKWPNVLDQYKV